MQNSLMVFILSVSDGKHPFWVNLVQKIKTVSLRNFVTRKFQYAEFKGAAHFFYIEPETPFLDKFSPKNQNCQFKLKLVLRLIRICQIQWRYFLFQILDCKHPFVQIWSKK